jgi:hypothetical protein
MRKNKLSFKWFIEGIGKHLTFIEINCLIILKCLKMCSSHRNFPLPFFSKNKKESFSDLTKDGCPLSSFSSHFHLNMELLILLLCFKWLLYCFSFFLLQQKCYFFHSLTHCFTTCLYPMYIETTLLYPSAFPYGLCGTKPRPEKPWLYPMCL